MGANVISMRTDSTWNSRTWHRKASKPVSLWLMTLVIAGLIHPILPEYRWVLIHLFTLGVITNAIVIWSQHFTEKFLHQRVDDAKRPAQLLKIRVLNIGIIITLIGQMSSQWMITSIGATIIGSVLAWHALSLAAQFRSAKRGQPFASAIVAYIASACCLPFGAFAGALLSKELSHGLQERVLLAHTVINILGFVGLAALGSLSVLFAAIWRTKIMTNFTPWAVGIIVLSLPITIGGILLNNGYLTAAGLSAYAAAWLLSMAGWGKASISKLSFSTSSITTAPLWLIGSLIWLAAQAMMHHGELYHVEIPTIALVIGFGAQLLIGVMSYLLPSIMGGGASAVRTGTEILNTAGLFRWTVLNGGLAIWLLTQNSWLRVVVSLLSIGALAIYVILLPRAVRAQRGVITKKRDPITPPEQPRFNQITAGISVLALILAAFGGLNPGAVPVTSVNSDVYPVTITAGDMAFSPDIIEVPLGKTLEVTLINQDDMVHDLKFANGIQTGRVAPGDEITVVVGEITETMDGWCTIAGHRAQGMVLEVRVSH